MPVATDKALQDEWVADPITCHVCATRQIEAIRRRDEPETRKAGLLIPVTRKGGGARG